LPERQTVALYHRHTKNNNNKITSDWGLIRANFNQQHDGGRSIDALKSRYRNVLKANEGFAKPAPKSQRSVSLAKETQCPFLPFFLKLL